MAISMDLFNKAAKSNFAITASNEAVLRKINAAGATIEDIVAFTKTPEYQNHGRGYHVLREFCAWFCKGKSVPKAAKKAAPKKAAEPAPAVSAAVPVIEPAPVSEPAPVVASAPVLPAPAADSANADTALLSAMRAFMGSVPAALNEEQVLAIVDERFKKLAELNSEQLKDAINAALAAAKPSRIIIETPKASVELPAGTVLHKDFKDILVCVNEGEPVYLYGPSGSGKSEIAKQVAKAMNLDYYFTGKVDLAYDLLGYMDASGKYVETQFYKAVKNGGLFLFDEIDASSEEALVAFNAVLNSGECAFPCGVVQAHENFRVMAAGNTCGLGGTSEYNSRRKLDAATLNRFVIFEVDYDPRIEESLGDEDIVKFVQVLRKAADKAGIEVILSYRNIKFLSKYVPVLGAKKALAVSVFNCLSKDDCRTLKNDSGIAELRNAGNKLAVAM